MIRKQDLVLRRTIYPLTSQVANLLLSPFASVTCHLDMLSVCYVVYVLAVVNLSSSATPLKVAVVVTEARHLAAFLVGLDRGFWEVVVEACLDRRLWSGEMGRLRKGGRVRMTSWWGDGAEGEIRSGRCAEVLCWQGLETSVKLLDDCKSKVRNVMQGFR